MSLTGKVAFAGKLTDLKKNYMIAGKIKKNHSQQNVYLGAKIMGFTGKVNSNLGRN